MPLKDAYDMYIKHVDSAHKLWAYFSVASFAVLGFLFGKETASWTTHTFAFLGLSYFFFAFGNLWQLKSTQKECCLLAAIVNDAAARDLKPNAFRVESTQPLRIMIFHVGCTALVLAAIALTYFGGTSCPGNSRSAAVTCPK